MAPVLSVIFMLAINFVRILLFVVLSAWIGLILYRKWANLGSTVPGISPSWWFPLGLEWRICSLLRCKEITTGVAIHQFANGFTKMFPNEGMAQGFAAHVRVALVWRADGFEKVLRSKRLKVIPYKFMRVFLGTGLLTSNGEKWRMRRKLLTPAFHFRILEDFIPTFNEQACKFAQILAEHEGLKPFNIVHPVAMATLDIICETAMGVKINAQEKSDSTYVKSLSGVCESLMSRCIKPWLYPDVLYNLSAEGHHFNKCLKIVKGFIAEVTERKLEQVKESRNNPQSGKIEEQNIGMKEKKPFLDLLIEAHLEDPEALPMKGILEETSTFLNAGYDTTASGVSWTLFVVATYPEVQAKIHQELDEIFGGDLEKSVTTEDMTRMKYLECCIKEALRLYPPGPLISHWQKGETEICGQKVKDGTFVIMNIFELHRDPKQWPDPERFIPERFLPENCANRHPFAYLPFSAGPRNCIGQKYAMLEMKVLLAWVLRRFRFHTNTKVDQLYIEGNVILFSKNGLPLSIERRTSTH